ncbi:MAG: acyl-CoA thioesterase [Afipia sp.]|nr:acyl-CoA thioesterase [Afipia sp.]
MDAPTRPKRQFKLADYPFRLTDNVRYGDLDPNKHVNNGVYSTYFETARVTLLRSGDRGLMPKGLSWMLVHLAIDFRAEMHWPGSFELGIGVSRLGRTSATFEQVVFNGDVCAASAEAVTVLVDAATRKPTPLTPDIIERFQPWMLHTIA